MGMMKNNSNVINEKPVTFRLLIIAFAFVIGVEYAASYIIRFDLMPTISVIGLARLAESIILIILVALYGNGLSSIGIHKDQLARGILRGAVWSLIIGCLTLTGFTCLFFAGINPLKFFNGSIPKGFGPVLNYYFVGGILAPVTEELFFRGIVFSCFRSIGFIPALIISTVFFASLHIPGAGVPVTQIIGGILFAISFEKEKNLMVPVVIHITANIAIFTLSVL
jgi:hypothetical protein